MGASQDEFGLKKYVIIASKINTDEEWKVPAVMALKLEEVGRDIGHRPTDSVFGRVGD
jgi:hypothetical protein